MYFTRPHEHLDSQYRIVKTFAVKIWQKGCCKALPKKLANVDALLIINSRKTEIGKKYLANCIVCE